VVLIIHIVIAVSSLAAAGLAWLKPSRAKLRTSYVLVALTVATGTYLAVALPGHLTQTCVTGLTYLAIAFTGIAAAQRRLRQENLLP